MTPDLAAVEVAIVAKTNAFRGRHKLGAVRRNARLDRAAQAYARYLARTGRFSHSADGRRPADRIKAAGYRYCQVAENLALNVDSRGFAADQLAGAAVTGWENSPGHRRNMLAPHVTEIGVGVAKAADTHRYLSVQLFGRPEALKFRFRIRNLTRGKVNYAYAGRPQTLPARVIMTHTSCLPGDLVFRNVRVRGKAAPAPARFAAKPGDEFVVRPGSGAIRIEHRPRLD